MKLFTVLTLLTSCAAAASIDPLSRRGADDPAVVLYTYDTLDDCEKNQHATGNGALDGLNAGQGICGDLSQAAFYQVKYDGDKCSAKIFTVAQCDHFNYESTSGRYFTYNKCFSTTTPQGKTLSVTTKCVA